MSALSKAEKDLQDFIDSLNDEDKAKALKYQAQLEAEAAASPGGWLEVIVKQTNHLTMLLIETIDEHNTQVVSQELKRIAR
jgi:hypothetical protein